MNHVSLIARGGRPHSIGGRSWAARSGPRGPLALFGPGQGRRRSPLARVRGESRRAVAQCVRLENVGGKMFAVDGSSEVDVTVRFSRHHAPGAGRVAHIPAVMTIIPSAPICAASGMRINPVHHRRAAPVKVFRTAHYRLMPFVRI
jgi:hypothetical protein